MIFTILFSTYILQPLQAVVSINYRLVKFQIALIAGILLFIVKNIMINFAKRKLGMTKNNHLSENLLDKQSSKLSPNVESKTESNEKGKDKLVTGGATNAFRNQPSGSTRRTLSTETKIRRKISAPGGAVRPVTVGGGFGLGLQNMPIYRSALGKIQTPKVSGQCQTAYHPLVEPNRQNISEELQKHTLLNCSSQIFPNIVEENKSNEKEVEGDKEETKLDPTSCRNEESPFKDEDKADFPQNKGKENEVKEDGEEIKLGPTSCSDDEGSSKGEGKADFPLIPKPRLSLKNRETDMTEDSGIGISSPSPRKPVPKPRTKFNLVPTPKPRSKLGLEPVPNQQSHIMIPIDIPQDLSYDYEADKNLSQDDVNLYSVPSSRAVTPPPALPKKFNRNAIRYTGKYSSSPRFHGPVPYTNPYHGYNF